MLPAVDARTGKQHEHHLEPATEEARTLAETITVKRDRLLASLTLIAGIGLIVGFPFADCTRRRTRIENWPASLPERCCAAR